MSWSWSFNAMNKDEAKALVAKRSGQTQYGAPPVVLDTITGVLDKIADKPVSVVTSGHMSEHPDDHCSCEISIKHLYFEKP